MLLEPWSFHVASTTLLWSHASWRPRSFLWSHPGCCWFGTMAEQNNGEVFAIGYNDLLFKKWNLKERKRWKMVAFPNIFGHLHGNTLKQTDAALIPWLRVSLAFGRLRLHILCVKHMQRHTWKIYNNSYIRILMTRTSIMVMVLISLIIYIYSLFDIDIEGPTRHYVHAFIKPLHVFATCYLSTTWGVPQNIWCVSVRWHGNAWRDQDHSFHELFVAIHFLLLVLFK